GTAAILDRPDAGLGRHAVDRARHLLREELRETLPVAAEPAQRDGLLGADLEAADALEDVRRPARLAELAVVHDVEAGLDLPKHDLLDGSPEEGRLLGPGPRVRPLEQGGRTDQAADVGRQDTVFAAKHQEAGARRAGDSSASSGTSRGGLGR